MTSDREAYVYIQLPGRLETVLAALLRVRTLPDGTQVGRFRYGDRYLARPQAVALDPFRLPLAKEVFEFTQLRGIPGAVRDAADAWGRRVIEHKLERGPADLQEVDYLLHCPQDGAGYLSFGLQAEPPAPRRAYNRMHQLDELIAASQAIEEGKRVAAHLLEQLDPGTSMGGARPKATIEDGRSFAGLALARRLHPCRLPVPPGTRACSARSHRLSRRTSARSRRGDGRATCWHK